MGRFIEWIEYNSITFMKSYTWTEWIYIIVPKIGSMYTHIDFIFIYIYVYILDNWYIGSKYWIWIWINGFGEIHWQKFLEAPADPQKSNMTTLGNPHVHPSLLRKASFFPHWHQALSASKRRNTFAVLRANSTAPDPALVAQKRRSLFGNGTLIGSLSL